jgi:cytochrome b561
MDSIMQQMPRPNGSSDARPGSGHAPASPRSRSPLTRVIHLLLLLVVLHQLIGSEFMRLPVPGDPPGWTLSLHEDLGLVNLAIVAAFWAWTLVRSGETRLGRLLPWLSLARLREVMADLSAQLRRLAQGRPPDDADGALASAIHGLGLLAVTAMAVTGGIYFFTTGTPVARPVLSLHKLIANLVWIYLFAHAGLAVLHHLLGSDIFARMFWTGPRGRRALRERQPPPRGI